MLKRPYLVIYILFLSVTILAQEVDCSPSKPLVRFGINLRHSPISLYERYQPLMDYLTRNTPYRFELKVSRSYREALRDLGQGKTQIASLGDGGFLDAMLLYGATPVVKPLNREGKPFYRCLIVAQSGGRLIRMTDLPGKRMAFGAHHSVSGNLIPRMLLGRQDISSADLADAVNLENHTAVAKAVLKGMFDAGAVKDVFAERYQRFGLRVLAASEPIPSAPLVAGAAAPKPLVKAVAEALLKLDPRNPADRFTMSAWDREFQNGFAPAHPADYRDLLRQFKAKPNGCSTACHR